MLNIAAYRHYCHAAEIDDIQLTFLDKARGHRERSRAGLPPRHLRHD